MKLVWILALPLMAQEVIPLHPDWKPGATPEKIEERGKDGVKDRSIAEVSQPTLTVYLPSKEKATGKAILICPGGGYAHLAIDKEGHDVARWLTEIGIAGVVLKYRLPGSSNMRPSLGDLQQARDSAKVAIEDAELAMKMVRTNAPKWNVKPHSVGMMGFSAGGHLAAMLGMIGSAESKPDFLVLVYPAIPKGIEVTAATPKTFLVHADDDRLSAGDNSVRFYLALKKAGVNSEMHIYSGGGHGFGVKSTDKTSATWPQSFAAWVRTL